LSNRLNSPGRRKIDGQPVLDLLEEAVALLRSQPLENICCYHLGALPFTLGLVYFWADMAAGAFAREHLAGGALGLALLWIWMKCWQAVYAERLKHWIMQTPPAPLTPGRLLRIALVQAATSPWGLVVLPLAALMTIPFGWCSAFFQNLTVLDSGDREPLGEQIRGAWRQALLWPRQNHLLLLIVSIFSVVVALNILIALLALPQLFKTLFGIESLFDMQSFSMLNSTLWVIVFALSYLVIDPLVKTAYLLRCYQGRSLQTGEDLLASLRIGRKTARLLAALLLCGLLATAIGSVTPAAAAEATPAPAAPAQLDRAIEQELSGIEYSWRMPRPTLADAAAEESGFWRIAAETVGYWGRVLKGTLNNFFDWLDKLIKELFPKIDFTPLKADTDGTDLRFIALYLLLGLAACAAGLVARRQLQSRRRRRQDAPDGIRSVAIDLESELIEASDLPRDQWLSLAAELLRKGERRLALRAYYLADLAGLADAELLSMARSKSDADYLRELQRNGYAGTELVNAFSQNILLFQQVWYGMREVSDELFEHFHHNHQSIMAHVHTA
jgi:hypothetical protein